MKPASFLSRHALSLWFLGIAVLGAIECRRIAFPEGVFVRNATGWLWLAGTLACAAIGMVLFVVEQRRR